MPDQTFFSVANSYLNLPRQETKKIYSFMQSSVCLSIRSFICLQQTFLGIHLLDFVDIVHEIREPCGLESEKALSFLGKQIFLK